MGDIEAFLLIVIIKSDKCPISLSGGIDALDSTCHLSAQTTGAIDSNLLGIVTWFKVIEVFDSAWIAECNHAIRYVIDNHTTRTNNCPLADFNTRNHHCSCTDPCALTNVYVSTQCSLRRDVYKVFHRTLVIYRGTCIQDAVTSDSGATLHNCSLHDYRAFTNCCIWRYNRRWMHNRSKLAIQFFGYLLASHIITNTDDNR